MKKKSHKTKKRVNNSIGSAAKPGKSFKLKRRTLIRCGIAAALLVPMAFAVSGYIDNHEVLHDLSAIGKGKPVLVQIHDPQCPRCQQLLSSVNSVLDEFPDLEFRIANIKTTKGGVFARRHNVSNVTLLIFDDRGRRLDVSSGMQEDDQVRRFIKRNYTS